MIFSIIIFRLVIHRRCGEIQPIRSEPDCDSYSGKSMGALFASAVARKAISKNPFDNDVFLPYIWQNSKMDKQPGRSYYAAENGMAIIAGDRFGTAGL